METVGINASYLLMQCGIPFLLIITWLILAWVALRQLRKRPLADNAKAIWAALIICVPLLGAVAFFIVQPSEEM